MASGWAAGVGWLGPGVWWLVLGASGPATGDGVWAARARRLVASGWVARARRLVFRKCVLKTRKSAKMETENRSFTFFVSEKHSNHDSGTHLIMFKFALQ